MRSLEDLFIREFKNEVRVVGNKDIYSVPLPDVCKTWEVSGTAEYGVQGIEDDYYSLLNKTFVRKLPQGYIAKRRVIDKATRSYKRNEEGAFVYQDFKVPTGSTVVLSDTNISLPYKRYVNDSEGFGYVDFIEDTGKGIKYMYAIPNTNLYKINQTALAISVKNMKNYQGIGYLSWDMGILYIHVIPYSPSSKYTGSKILKTGRGLNYQKEIKEISDYWEEKGIIPPINLCALQNGENLCLRSTIVGYDSYIPIEPVPISVKEIFGSEEVGVDESGSRKSL